MKPFSSVIQFIFGCRHRHLSRVFTIKHRTYKVCFDCGREFDLPSVREPAPLGGKGKARDPKSPYLRTGAASAMPPSRRHGDVNRAM